MKINIIFALILIHFSTTAYSQVSRACYNAFQRKALQLHNNYRAIHGAPPLKINKKATSFAKNWANFLLRLGQIKHSPDKNFGENLFLEKSSVPYRTTPRDCESI